MGLIRALLAFTVVFAHSPWNDGVALVGGRNAVQLFYVISGFLIAHVLRTNATYLNPISFYANRALRIYPTYYVVLLLSLGPALLTNSPFLDFTRHAGATATTLLTIANVTIFGQDWAMFGQVVGGDLSLAIDFTQADTPLYRGLIIPQAWTLGVELTFYLLAPFLLKRSSVIVAALVLSLTARAWLFHVGIGATDPWSYRFFPAELSLFLLGALANRWGLAVWRQTLPNPQRLAQASALAVATLAALICAYSMVPLPEAVKTVALIGIFVILLPLTFLHRPRGRWDRWLGELSYPVYIGHILMILVVGIVLRRLQWQMDAAALTLFNLALSIAFASLLNLLLERPLERLRARVRRGTAVNLRGAQRTAAG